MNSKEIGKKLIMLRNGKSRAEVATAVGISVSALGMYETGERVPRDLIKIRLAEHYNISVQEIFF